MEEMIHIGDMTLSCQVSGYGSQPVVVMHGWGCRADTVRVLADAATTPQTTVYNLDMPGFGNSTEPPQTWGTYEYADFIEQFMAHKGIMQPVVIGHSFGGRVAIVLASRGLASKLILVDAAGIKPRRSLVYYLKVYSFKTARKLAPFLMGRQRGNAFIERMRRRAGSSDYASSSPVMRRVMSRVVNEDLRSVMPDIKVPTLLVWGDKDTATPIKDARLMARLIPDSGLVSYPEAGHYSFLDRPAQTVAVIRSFLKS